MSWLFTVLAPRITCKCPAPVIVISPLWCFIYVLFPSYRIKDNSASCNIGSESSDITIQQQRSFRPRQSTQRASARCLFCSSFRSWRWSVQNRTCRWPANRGVASMGQGGAIAPHPVEVIALPQLEKSFCCTVYCP